MSGFCGRYAMAPSPPGGLFPMPVLWSTSHLPLRSTVRYPVSLRTPCWIFLEKNLEAGLTLKAGCGIGYEFSTLRPKGAYVSGAGAYTSGPLSFMDIFDKMCFTVSSAGGRRGAQMATFDINHPDVGRFYPCQT